LAGEPGRKEGTTESSTVGEFQEALACPRTLRHRKCSHLSERSGVSFHRIAPGGSVMKKSVLAVAVLLALLLVLGPGGGKANESAATVQERLQQPAACAAVCPCCGQPVLPDP